MKISGVLALFPLTIVATFVVLQQQVELSRPFERHAGAYTDVGHILAAIKHAGNENKKIVVRPMTIPRRPAIEVTKVDSPAAAPNIIAATSTNKEEAMLEEIWRDHVSSSQAAPASEQKITDGQILAQMSSAKTQNPQQSQGLISPVMQMAQAQTQVPKARDGERSEGFSSDRENAAKLDVIVLSGNINGGAGEIEAVEFTNLADENNILHGDKGRLSFEYLLNQSVQTLSGIFTAPNHVRTRVDLPLEIGTFGSLVPLMTIDSMDKFLRSKNIAAAGGFIMVDLDQQIIDVEIDRPYQLKIYLDANLKVAEADESARFAMFLGVAPGNVMLRYLSHRRDIASRVALVVADEILYDLPVLGQQQTHSFGLFEMESLSLSPRELTVSGRSIRPFNQKNTAIQDSLNYYSLEYASNVIGTRRYKEIDHLGTTFYVGHSLAEKIVIPGQGFLNEVLAFHQIDRLERECLVQVNLPSEREVYSMKMLGEGGLGSMVLDESYLNRDGTVSLEATEFSTHAFVVGDIQGRIHMRVDYLDGSVDFISSYCAAGAYLVEQL